MSEPLPLTANDMAVLLMLGKYGAMGSKLISDKTGIRRTQLYNLLQKLRARNLVYMHVKDTLIYYDLSHEAKAAMTQNQLPAPEEVLLLEENNELR